MNSEDNSEWGKWNFTSNSQDKLTLLRNYFKCTSCKSLVCEEISDKSWRILIRESLIRNRTSSNETTDVLTSSKELVDNLLVIDPLNKLDECKLAVADDSDILLEDESDKLKVGGSSYTVLTSEKYLDELDSSVNDEALASVEDCCTLLKKGPMVDFLHKFKGKDLHKTLKLLKQNLSTEEGIANLILSICSPEKDDILEQSRWAPVLLQQLILPEMLQRDLPISRVLAVSIIQLASSFPDASVQFLCIPLLVEPLENKSLALSSPVEEILRDVIEKSFQQQQRVSLFRSFFKEASRKDKLPVKENYFPILHLLAETSGAFTEADSDFLMNLINWLEISSQEHFSNPKFSKFFVAVLKGIAQDVEARREETSHFLSQENILKLKNIVSQNKTFFRKIAEKTLDSIC